MKENPKEGCHLRYLSCENGHATLNKVIGSYQKLPDWTKTNKKIFEKKYYLRTFLLKQELVDTVHRQVAATR